MYKRFDQAGLCVANHDKISLVHTCTGEHVHGLVPVQMVLMGNIPSAKTIRTHVHCTTKTGTGPSQSLNKPLNCTRFTHIIRVALITNLDIH